MMKRRHFCLVTIPFFVFRYSNYRMNYCINLIELFNALDKKDEFRTLFLF